MPLNNNLKVPYSDQFSIGMRNTVGDWNTSAAVARILSKDGFVFTLGNRYPNGAFWMNGGQPWGNGVPGSARSSSVTTASRPRPPKCCCRQKSPLPPNRIGV